MTSFCISTQRSAWLMDEADWNYLTLTTLSRSPSALQHALSAATHSTVKSLPVSLLPPSDVESVATTKLSQEQRHILNTHKTAIFTYCQRIQNYFGEETKDELALRKGVFDKKENKPIKREYGTPLYWRVAATAIVYFQRFYLNNSFSDFEPQRIMLACVLLAGKTEDCHVSLSVIKQIDSSIKKEDVYEMELRVLEALHFNVRVFHPRNILPTIIGDCRRWAEQAGAMVGHTAVTAVVSNISALSDTGVTISVVEDKSTDGHINKKIKTEKKGAAKASRVHVDIVQNSSVSEPKTTHVSVETGSSEMRKLWLETAEVITNKVQCTHSIFLFTPTEIALSALKIGLQKNADLGHYVITFDAYLSYRFGDAMVEMLNGITGQIEEFLLFVNEVGGSS